MTLTPDLLIQWLAAGLLALMLFTGKQILGRLDRLERGQRVNGERLVRIEVELGIKLPHPEDTQ